MSWESTMRQHTVEVPYHHTLGPDPEPPTDERIARIQARDRLDAPVVPIAIRRRNAKRPLESAA
jgi:hypothetical protein